MLDKITDGQVPIDILRMVVNKSRKYSVIILWNGHSQSGKTTGKWYFANRILQIKKGQFSCYDKRNTWHEWDGKRYSATNAYEFVDLWDKNEDAVITLEESGESLNYLEWYSVMAKVFASTTRTQGLKRNICILDTVMSTDIQKHNKENIDFRMWTYKRYDETRTSIVRCGWVEIDYLKDRWRLRWLPNWIIHYTPKMLTIAKNYTNNLAIGLKKDIMEKNKRMVGLAPLKTVYNPNKPLTERNCPEWMKKEIGY